MTRLMVPFFTFYHISNRDNLREPAILYLNLIEKTLLSNKENSLFMNTMEYLLMIQEFNLHLADQKEKVDDLQL